MKSREQFHEELAAILDILARSPLFRQMSDAIPTEEVNNIAATMAIAISAAAFNDAEIVIHLLQHDLNTFLALTGKQAVMMGFGIGRIYGTEEYQAVAEACTKLVIEAKDNLDKALTATLFPNFPVGPESDEVQ